MTPEAFIQQKAAAAIQAIYNTEVAPGSLQVAVTRKEFEGDYTLVTFPLLKITRQAPDATGNAIGLWLVANVPEIAAYNSVKGFLNLSSLLPMMPSASCLPRVNASWWSSRRPTPTSPCTWDISATTSWETACPAS